MGAAVVVRGLRVSYGGYMALRGVDLSLPEGYVAVVGPSGSGKTTLLRAIAGLVEYEGSIAVRGRVVDGLPPWERGVALVQQVPGLLPHLSLLENVALAAELRAGLGRVEARRLAERLLAEVGLAGLGSRRPGELSGGQLQRAAIAAALATGAKVLLLDEPLSHLDRLTAERLRGLLARLRREGRDVVHVTHDLDEALALADYMAVLHGGRVVAAGEARKVYMCPRSVEAASLLGHSILDGHIIGLGEGLYSVAPDYVALRPRDGAPWRLRSVARERGRLVAVAESLVAEGASIVSYMPPGEAETLKPGLRVEPVLLGEPCRLETGSTP